MFLKNNSCNLYEGELKYRLPTKKVVTTVYYINTAKDKIGHVIDFTMRATDTHLITSSITIYLLDKSQVMININKSNHFQNCPKTEIKIWQ